jgi:hypothetical protein
MFADDIPEWFTGRRPTTGWPDRACGTCGAPPGEACRYLTSGGSHYEKTGTGWQPVENRIGAPCKRPHKGR